MNYKKEGVEVVGSGTLDDAANETDEKITWYRTILLFKAEEYVK